jgi:alkanesulfonate monooxygenase SsuD/methylene tetrahydromethanopterin reductase-like flavin-dependent oxidoreductase (luciferase family)
MLKFGFINFLENPAGKSERQIVEEQKYLSIRAEECGFDSVWLVEHHFSDYGHCVSAAVMLAALASATRVVRLGSGVLPLPFQNPVRVAEEFALVDLLSGGRLDFGIGRGFQPAEFRGYGVDQSKSRAIFREALEIILQAWTRDTVDFTGTHFKIEGLKVRPKPLQKPHPPVWMAAISPESFTYAGEHGFNLLCAPMLSADGNDLERNLQAYHAALRSKGQNPDAKEIAAMLMVHVAEDAASAEAEFAQSAVWSYRALSNSVGPSPTVHPVPGYERYPALSDFGARTTWAQIRDSDAVVWGTPRRCIEKIESLRTRLGLTTLLCWMRVGTLDHRKVINSMSLMQDYVIPSFRPHAEAAF